MDRALTPAEVALARTMFGDTIDYDAARVSNHKWWWFQPKHYAMAPRGCIHFHPKGDMYRDDFAACDLGWQGFFLHELTHVWQHQRGIFLPLARHPFCRYGYSFVPGRPFNRYGIEQQAEIVRHTFLLRHHQPVAGAPPLAQYESVLPFVGSR